MKRFNQISILTFGLVACGLQGCAPGGISDPVQSTMPAPSAASRQADTFKPTTTAGIPVAVSGDPLAYWRTTSTNKYFSARPDPFALHPSEVAFDRSQGAERLFTDLGGFSVRFEPPVETVVVPTIEEQPYRRLAGVIVGESVSALIDMGDGQGLKIINPGQVINGWTVVSIDENQAVLRRGGNILPREVIVRLESAPFGAGGSGNSNSGGNNGGGNSGGGGGPSSPGKKGPTGFGPSGGG